jgi:ABC-type branched-subunit amino acid transport system substrate-binding protein
MEPQPTNKPRMKPMASSTRAFFSLVAVALILGYLGRPPAQELGTARGGGQFVPGEAGEELQGDEATTAAEAQTADAEAAGGPGASKTSTKKTTGGRTTSAVGLTCAPGKKADGTYKNGDVTDVGVSATKIRLATTAVLDGPAASLLRFSPTGMKAVIAKVNAAGGICGRRLDLPKERVVNDGFRADLGHDYLKNFLHPDANIFALPVVPSAEGLASAIKAKDISRAGMPVVGSDGMRIDQYQDPWVWPVAAATVSTMRIIADYAYKVKGATSFAIVWDNKYKFGVEGRDAFVDQVKSLAGESVHLVDVPLDPDQSSYASQIADFNGTAKCGNQGCAAVVMLLLPDTAKLWLSGIPEMGRLYSAGAQTLFTEKFAQDCVNAIGAKCNHFAIWTGYNPPIGSYASLPGVADYVRDVNKLSPGIDVKNQFLQGSYFGMGLFVEALKKVGPFLTRDGLKGALDSMDYKTDMASDLSWKPSKHHANVRARSFSVVVGEGAFNGWADEGTGWRLDPSFGG